MGHGQERGLKGGQESYRERFGIQVWKVEDVGELLSLRQVMACLFEIRVLANSLKCTLMASASS